MPATTINNFVLSLQIQFASHAEAAKVSMHKPKVVYTKLPLEMTQLKDADVESPNEPQKIQTPRSDRAESPTSVAASPSLQCEEVPENVHQYQISDSDCDTPG